MSESAFTLIVILTTGIVLVAVAFVWHKIGGLNKRIKGLEKDKQRLEDQLTNQQTQITAVEAALARKEQWDMGRLVDGLETAREKGWVQTAASLGFQVAKAYLGLRKKHSLPTNPK
ncbi:MAG: hypothetical protein ACOCX1_03525 [Fimbriimonadaceae bacterium]